MRPLHRFAALILIGGTTLMHSAVASALPPYSLGQRLSAAQLSTLDTLKSVEIEGRSYRVLSTTLSSQGWPLSLVVGSNGVVGQTFHEVLIAELPPQTARQRFASVIAQAASVQYQDHAELSILRFATLEQAVAALAQIRATQPQVQAGLPINFSPIRPR